MKLIICESVIHQCLILCLVINKRASQYYKHNKQSQANNTKINSAPRCNLYATRITIIIFLISSKKNNNNISYLNNKIIDLHVESVSQYICRYFLLLLCINCALEFSLLSLVISPDKQFTAYFVNCAALKKNNMKKISQ